MIVIEGPDGAGKTTLIKHLAERFNLHIAPRVVTSNTVAMLNLRQWVERDVEEGPATTIYDRYRLFSEPIYGSVLRPRAEEGFDNLQWYGLALQRLFTNRAPLIIYCLPSLDVVKANIEGDVNNRAVEHKIEAIYSAYVAQAGIVHVLYGRTLIYDYTNPEALEGIDHYVREYTNWVRSLGNV